jgi:hypothetical protein
VINSQQKDLLQEQEDIYLRRSEVFDLIASTRLKVNWFVRLRGYFKLSDTTKNNGLDKLSIFNKQSDI